MHCLQAGSSGSGGGGSCPSTRKQRSGVRPTDDVCDSCFYGKQAAKVICTKDRIAAAHGSQSYSPGGANVHHHDI